MNKLKAENSEMKAKQLMSAFASQGVQGMSNLLDKDAPNKDDEIKSLRQQLSLKTNEILSLQDEKEELEVRLEERNKEIVSPTVIKNEDNK